MSKKRPYKRMWVMREGKLLEVDLDYRPKAVAPYIHTDSMPMQLHPSNMQPVDSKSAFRRIMKEHGHDIRTGADRVASNQPKLKDTTADDYARDVAIAREQLRSGTAPLTEFEREKCARINEQLKNKA